MKIPSIYHFTRRMSSFLATIEANNAVISSVAVPFDLERTMRSQSMLRSALFSARIEGNRLTRGEVSSFSDLTSSDQNKLEVANLHRAIKYILEHFAQPRDFSKEDILGFHAEAMKNILPPDFCGVFRKGHEGVFDSSGNLIYHSPPPSMVAGYIAQLVTYINSKEEKSIPIKAALAHLAMEDIHPFVDGSGRVGRLVQMAVLAQGGYGMKGFISPEELIEANRQSYYHAIEVSHAKDGDATEFVELMLEFLADSSTSAKNLLLEKQQNSSPLDTLAPRRRELVEIIREHQMVSLDFLHRRFLAISPRLLSYDLKKLTEAGFIKKVGTTRGALYAPKE